MPDDHQFRRQRKQQRRAQLLQPSAPAPRLQPPPQHHQYQVQPQYQYQHQAKTKTQTRSHAPATPSTTAKVQDDHRVKAMYELLSRISTTLAEAESMFIACIDDNEDNEDANSQRQHLEWMASFCRGRDEIRRAEERLSLVKCDVEKKRRMERKRRRRTEVRRSGLVIAGGGRVRQPLAEISVEDVVGR